MPEDVDSSRGLILQRDSSSYSVHDNNNAGIHRGNKDRQVCASQPNQNQKPTESWLPTCSFLTLMPTFRLFQEVADNDRPGSSGCVRVHASTHTRAHLHPALVNRKPLQSCLTL